MARAALGGRRPVVGFEGASSVADAERLAGAELRVPEDALAALEPGVLTTCTSWSGAASRRQPATPVGEVARVEGGAGRALLAVAGAERGGADTVCRQPVPDHRRRAAAGRGGCARGAARGERAGATRAAASGEDEGHGVKFDIVTVFPRMIEAGLSEGVVHRGIESGRAAGAGPRPARLHDRPAPHAWTTRRTAAGRGW